MVSCFGISCFTQPELFELPRSELKKLYDQSINVNNGKLIVRGIFARADTKNNNKRVYPKYILKREVAKFEQDHILRGTALGELDHPNYASRYFKCMNLPNISHQVLGVQWKGDQLWGTIEILPTPSGLLLWELYSQGIKLGVSSRGWASLRTDSRSKCVFVDDDFELITFDFVTEPSTKGAYLVPLAKAYRQRVPDQTKYVQMASLGHGVVSMRNIPRLPSVHHLQKRIKELQEEALISHRLASYPEHTPLDISLPNPPGAPPMQPTPSLAAARLGRGRSLDQLLLFCHYIVYPGAPYLDREEHARDFQAHLALFAVRAHLADQDQFAHHRADFNAVIIQACAQEVKRQTQGAATPVKGDPSSKVYQSLPVAVAAGVPAPASSPPSQAAYPAKGKLPVADQAPVAMAAAASVAAANAAASACKGDTPTTGALHSNATLDVKQLKGAGSGMHVEAAQSIGGHQNGSALLYDFNISSGSIRSDVDTLGASEQHKSNGHSNSTPGLQQPYVRAQRSLRPSRHHHHHQQQQLEQQGDDGKCQQVCASLHQPPSFATGALVGHVPITPPTSASPFASVHSQAQGSTLQSDHNQPDSTQRQGSWPQPGFTHMSSSSSPCRSGSALQMVGQIQLRSFSDGAAKDSSNHPQATKQSSSTQHATNSCSQCYTPDLLLTTPSAIHISSTPCRSSTNHIGQTTRPSAAQGTPVEAARHPHQINLPPPPTSNSPLPRSPQNAQRCADGLLFDHKGSRHMMPQPSLQDHSCQICVSNSDAQSPVPSPAYLNHDGSSKHCGSLTATGKNARPIKHPPSFRDHIQRKKSLSVGQAEAAEGTDSCQMTLLHDETAAMDLHPGSHVRLHGSNDLGAWQLHPMSATHTTAPVLEDSHTSHASSLLQGTTTAPLLEGTPSCLLRGNPQGSELQVPNTEADGLQSQGTWQDAAVQHSGSRPRAHMSSDGLVCGTSGRRVRTSSGLLQAPQVQLQLERQSKDTLSENQPGLQESWSSEAPLSVKQGNQVMALRGPACLADATDGEGAVAHSQGGGDAAPGCASVPVGLQASKQGDCSSKAGWRLSAVRPCSKAAQPAQKLRDRERDWGNLQAQMGSKQAPGQYTVQRQQWIHTQVPTEHQAWDAQAIHKNDRVAGQGDSSRNPEEFWIRSAGVHLSPGLAGALSKELALIKQTLAAVRAKQGLRYAACAAAGGAPPANMHSVQIQ